MSDVITALTTEQKAVAVAKDVLAQLDAEKIMASTHCYVDFRNFDDIHKLDDARDAAIAGIDLQKFLIAEQPICNACALGSAFLSYVRLYDNFQLRSNQELNNDWKEVLSDAFSELDLATLETLFQGTASYGIYKAASLYFKDENRVSDDDEDDDEYANLDDERYEEIMAWHNKYLDDSNDERLRRLMQNIIDNNGVLNLSLEK